MSRAALAVLLLGAVLLPLAGRAAVPPAAGEAAHVARPDAALLGIRLDYASPPAAVGGGPASFAPLDGAATGASIDDAGFLAYRSRDDLGGFLAAPVGRPALTGGGRTIVAVRGLAPQLPLFRTFAGGRVSTYAGAPAAAAPDDGARPVPHLGVPVPPPPPESGNVPPANADFGGRPSPRPHGATPPTTTTSPRRRPRPPRPRRPAAPRRPPRSAASPASRSRATTRRARSAPSPWPPATAPRR